MITVALLAIVALAAGCAQDEDCLLNGVCSLVGVGRL
jgi:hypothetical protein